VKIDIDVLHRPRSGGLFYLLYINIEDPAESSAWPQTQMIPLVVSIRLTYISAYDK